MIYPLHMGARKQSLVHSPNLSVYIIALVGVFLVSVPNLIDPMMGYDDYPALLGQPEWFWGKTLTEGRWLNYIWHLRGVVTPAWLNFAVYQGIWAVLAAAFAVAAVGSTESSIEDRWFASMLALFIVVAPPATFIAQWFNTLIPGLALVALYAVLGCWMSQRRHRMLLLPFTVVTLMAYTTYPLILLAVCLVRTKHKSLRDLIGLLTLFILSYAVAVLVIYVLNWQVHGIFGIPMAEWRDAHPVTGLSANIPLIKQTIHSLLTLLTFNTKYTLGFHPLVLLVATIYLIRVAPKDALYLSAGLWLGMALMMVQVMKLGLPIPSRSFAFVWFFYAAIVVRAVILLSRGEGWVGRIARNLLVVTLFLYLAQTFLYFTLARPWQSETRDLAQAVAQHEGPVLVYGDLMALDSAQLVTLIDERALSFRLEYLTSRQTIFCSSVPIDCTAAQNAGAHSYSPAPFVVNIANVDGVTRLGYTAP
jgi:hypothetical protein